MTVRYLFLFALLGLVFVFAGLLAMGWTIWWLKPLQWLGHYQLFHIVAHSGIFAGVVFLTYPHKWLWIFVLGGAVILELVQLAAGGFTLTKSLLSDSLFDIMVDLAGAVGCWLVLTQRRLKMAQNTDGTC